jgi:hypothetical protein
MAEPPASTIVRIPIISKTDVNSVFANKKLNRINKYTPAVTSVDEWTSADTGVGAAIAAGNHAENGTWALFVHADKIRIVIKRAMVISINPLIELNDQ